MSVFIDTSAMLAVLDADDRHHPEADAAWQEMLSSRAALVTTNNVLVETFALVQHRLGLDALKVFQEDVVPVLDIEWITESLHQSACEMLFLASKRRLSLVDCSSFAVMRIKGLKKAFAFGDHFREHRFVTIS